MQQDCLSCKHFRSFADDYFDDQEPLDNGFCNNGRSVYYYNKGAGINIICHKYEKVKHATNPKKTN